ncbi:hypothetical protein EDB83DRAFT_2347360 [Lactarius deliciosus]|nr:hypothetical protein EDB83DRAFT_2347360 [Lactarius deliciosus]
MASTRPTQLSSPPSPSYLPTEILLHIFAFCVAPDESNNEAFTALHIVRISHVCHTPFLATTMLERSKPTPIVIRANLTPGDAFKAVSRALRSSDRAKEIDLRSGPSKHLAKHSMIYAQRLLSSNTSSLRGYVFDVPSSIFSHCQFPLQTLILERCHVMPSALVRAVTAFSIGDISIILRSLSPLHAGVVEETHAGRSPSPLSPTFQQFMRLTCFIMVFFLLHFIIIPTTASLVLQFLILGSTRQIPVEPIRSLIVSQANLQSRRGLRYRAGRELLTRFFYADDALSPNIDIHFGCLLCRRYDVLLLMLPSVRELYGPYTALELNGNPVNRALPLARLPSFRNGETQDVGLRALCDQAMGSPKLIVCYSDASRQDMEELAKHLDLAPSNGRS